MTNQSRSDVRFTISARGKAEVTPVMSFLKEGFGSIPVDQIDSLFGFVECCKLYGGRPFVQRQISNDDVDEMYAQGIGLRLPLTNSFVDEAEYQEYAWLFEKYHRVGNSIIVTEDNLARWIRRDYSRYRIEASVIKNIDTHEKIAQALDLYDTVILPMWLNVHEDFLNDINCKDRITLFANAGCAFNCPAKICYHAISKMNKFTGVPSNCSKNTIPRQVLGMIDFNIAKLSEMGFRRFKLLRVKPGGITGF